MQCRSITAAAVLLLTFACWPACSQTAVPGPDQQPPTSQPGQQGVTPEQYMDYLLPILQQEPSLEKPLVFSALRPVPDNDPWLNEMVRICRTVHVDVWCDGSDWSNVEKLVKTYKADVYLKVMPFQLTKANDPDDRYDLSQPMNNGIWKQLNRLTGLMDKWIGRAPMIVSCDLHSELWPWPDETKYGTGDTDTKYANRAHRYRAAVAIVRAYVPGAQVYWYNYSNVQKHPGDVWHYDRGAQHINSTPDISDAINHDSYRMQLQAEWLMDQLPVMAGFESGNYDGENQGKPIIPLISIGSGYVIRSAPNRPEWSRMGKYDWYLDYPDGNDYQTGKFLYRPESCGDRYAWLADRIQHVTTYGSPWYMNDICQDPAWQAEFWRRFLIFCRGARGAHVDDLERPTYSSGS